MITDVCIYGDISPYDSEKHSNFLKKVTPNNQPLTRCPIHSTPLSIPKEGGTWDDDDILVINTAKPPLFGFWTNSLICYDTCNDNDNDNDNSRKNIIKKIENEYPTISASISKIEAEIVDFKKELYKVNSSINKQSKGYNNKNPYFETLEVAINNATANLNKIKLETEMDDIKKEKATRIYNKLIKLREGYLNDSNLNKTTIDNLIDYQSQLEQKINICSSSLKNHLRDIIIIYCISIESNIEITDIKNYLVKYNSFIDISEYEKIYLTYKYTHKVKIDKNNNKALFTPKIIKQNTQ